MLSLVLPSQGNLRGTRLFKKNIETASTIFRQNVTINKQQKSKDKSQLLKGPPRLYKPFYLLFTSSALPYFARNDILLIYIFFYYCGQEVYKLIFISPGRVSILYPVGISRFMYNTSAVYHGRQTTLKPNVHATGLLVTE